MPPLLFAKFIHPPGDDHDIKATLDTPFWAWKVYVFDVMTARNGQEEKIHGTNLALQYNRASMINSLGKKWTLPPSSAGLFPDICQKSV